VFNAVLLIVPECASLEREREKKKKKNESVCEWVFEIRNQKSCCEMSFACFIHGVKQTLLGILIWFFFPPAEINLSFNLGDFSLQFLVILDI
jgi:hypothetical protein